MSQFKPADIRDKLRQVLVKAKTFEETPLPLGHDINEDDDDLEEVNGRDGENEADETQNPIPAQNNGRLSPLEPTQNVE